MPNRTIFTPESLVDLQRICDDVIARLQADGHNVPAADVAYAIMNGAATCDDLDLIARRALSAVQNARDLVN